MKRLVCAVALIATAFASNGGAQARPNFAGTWALVPDKSAPAAAAHQAEVTITQSDSTLSVSRKAIRYSSAGSENVTYALAYIFDAADHDSPVSPLPAGLNPADVKRPTTQSKYRAMWTQTQLVVITQQLRQPDATGFSPRRTERVTFSLDADGFLTIESIAITDPTPGGPTQPTPIPMRSVYKKASYALGISN